MCFSPAVSFVSSADLIAIGIFTLTISAMHEILFASIPLLFAVQQFIEGVLWLVLVPFSLWMIEPEPRRKNIMLGCIAAGVGIALFTVHALSQFPVTARITSYCILYEYPAPESHSLLMLYVLAICGAFFCSGNHAIVRLGWVNIAAFLRVLTNE